MDSPKLFRSRSTKIGALTAVKHSTFKEVAESFDIPIQTLKRWKKAAVDAGTMGDGPGLARPAPRKIHSDAGKRKLVTLRMMNAIKQRIASNPGLSCNNLCSLVSGLDSVPRRTVNNIILHDLGLPSRVAVKKPLLTPQQVAGRLDWARHFKDWSPSQWRKVLWSDESHIEIFVGGSSFHRRVRRSRQQNRYLQKFVQKTVKHPAKLMAWACFGNGKLDDLHILPEKTMMNGQYYLEVLQKHLCASMRKTGCSVFMQGPPATSLTW